MPDPRWDDPPGYPGPPPGADGPGHWEGGGKWRPPTWVPDAPPPPDPVPDPPTEDPGPPPERPRPQFDWTGNATTKPPPGGFSSWDEYNNWRAGLREGTFGGGVSIAPRPGMPPRRTGAPPNPAGADRLFGSDPSELQDRLRRDRLRLLGPNANPNPPQGTSPARQYTQRNLPFPAPVILPDVRDPNAIRGGVMQMNPGPIRTLGDLLQIMQMQPQQAQPINPLQVLLARLGVL